MWILSFLMTAAAPDLIVIGAKIPTVPSATAFAVSAGKITQIGSDSAISTLAGPTTKKLEAHGRLLLPGLIDSHIHFISGGVGLDRLDLSGARSIADLQAKVKAYADAHPDRPWILGRGWSYDLFKQLKPAYPTRAMLDQVVADRPVFVRSYDGHTGWANSAALKAAKITAATKDLQDGQIIREADGKTPAGALLEEAMSLISESVPKASNDELSQAMLRAQTLALSRGLTAINDFVGDDRALDVYLAAEKSGTLKLHVFFSPSLETPLAEAEALRERIKTSRGKVRFGSLKGFVDGVIESDTAAFLAPYADQPKHKGVPHLDPTALREAIVPADAKGFAVSLHAIGDLAVRISLDAFELAAKTNQTSDRRHRIEHIEVLDPADAPRFAKLQVIASMQPVHAEPADKPGTGTWEVKVGKKRLPMIFAWQSLAQAGARLAFGSDWSVATLDPLMGMGVGLSRKNGHGLPAEGWVATQALPFKDLIAGYTTGAAYALHADDLGELAIGKAADFVVLSDKVDPDEAQSVYWGTVDVTAIGGEVVYARGP